ncbi:hypothetical protein NC652_039864 [Populus alba x Populus x berolinensis]|nr:hypothetical protein NC652_039864 [Populus alba x Populus x berolinensis]
MKAGMETSRNEQARQGGFLTSNPHIPFSCKPESKGSCRGKQAS